MGSGMSADQVAQKLGISRTAVYRFEKGGVAKIETLLSLSELLQVSLASLMGVGIEYIPSAVTYFERLRQLEESADQITILAGPLSSLLSSQGFVDQLEPLLKESVTEDVNDRDKLDHDVERVIEILRERRQNYQRRGPGVVNLISALDIVRLLHSGFVGRPFLPRSDLAQRQARARVEVEHVIGLMEEQPIGVQIGLVTGAVPHTGFQIFRSGERRTMSISPFRLGEQPNIQLGVAMITSATEAIALHQNIVDQMWAGALKGQAAGRYLRELIKSLDEPHA
jgi:transcriptional regulator with XRE-family HTH domain